VDGEPVAVDAKIVLNHRDHPSSRVKA
jgi:hypothetical protein